MRARLCLFTDSVEPSGVGEHMLTLAEALRLEYDISFMCWNSTALYMAAQSRGFTVYEASVDWYAMAEHLSQVVRPDIVHVHAGVGWEGHGGAWAARRAGVDHVVRTEHLPFLIKKRWQHEEYLYRIGEVDTIICVSQGVRQSYVDAGAPGSKLCVVRNGIRGNQRAMGGDNSRERLLSELGLGPGAKLVLTVGRIKRQKGYRYLLGAIPQVIADVPDAHFLVAGDGPLRDKLVEQAEAAGLLLNVHFLGQRSDIWGLLRACDLFVLPSLFEGLPLVVLEAMLMERPVVATKVCGTSEAVVDGQTGRLVPVRNSAALAREIIRTLQNPEQAARWGRAGCERVMRHFTADRMVRETSEIYNGLLGLRGSSLTNSVDQGSLIVQAYSS